MSVRVTVWIPRGDRAAAGVEQIVERAAAHGGQVGRVEDAIATAEEIVELVFPAKASAQAFARSVRRPAAALLDEDEPELSIREVGAGEILFPRRVRR